MRLHFTGLWRNNDFLKLWVGQTVSLLGSSVTFLALPLTAVLVLEATPAEMGLLAAAGTLPSLLFGLFTGVWVDRQRRRPILIAADVGRAILLLVIPVMAILSVLRIEFLYGLAFLLGVLTLFFGVAYRSFLPSLVGRAQLIDANSNLEMSRSASEIAGPALAGGLVQLVTAPIAIVADALSFLVSAVSLSLIHTPEAAPVPRESRQDVRREIVEGLALVSRDRLLRAVTGCAGTVSFFNQVLEAVWVLYVTRELGIEPGLLGMIFASGSIGFLVGSLLCEPMTQRFGPGRAIPGGLIVLAAGDLLIPLAGGSMATIVAMLITGQFLFGLGLTFYNINQVSLRQQVTPDHLQGRMNATISFVVSGIAPIGALLGGALGETIQLRTTLLIAVLGELLAVFWLLFSPVRQLRQYPVIEP